MRNEFEFFRTTMPDTRLADYYLGCLEGSVFMDFDDCENDCICIKRISFDGYGCCDVKKAIPMDQIDSTTFRKLMETDAFDQSVLTTIIIKTLFTNNEFIWKDALIEYGLC